jgi:hypothetical protein
MFWAALSSSLAPKRLENKEDFFQPESTFIIAKKDINSIEKVMKAVLFLNVPQWAPQFLFL